jgi:hypothetical protein
MAALSSSALQSLCPEVVVACGFQWWVSVVGSGRI